MISAAASPVSFSGRFGRRSRRLRSLVVGGALGATTIGCGSPSGLDVEPSGEQTASIVNGVAEPNHRYVVKLGGCTGTIISKHSVITAGHCGTGISTVSYGPPTVPGTTPTSVVSVVRHPK